MGYTDARGRPEIVAAPWFGREPARHRVRDATPAEASEADEEEPTPE